MDPIRRLRLRHPSGLRNSSSKISPGGAGGLSAGVRILVTSMASSAQLALALAQ
jgi:hypothetical protein